MSTQTANDSAEMTFGEHLDELRKILIRVALVFALLFIVLFTMKGVVLDVVFAPVTPEFPTNRLFTWLATAMGSDALNIHPESVELFNNKMAGQFMLHIKSSLVGAIVIAFPFLIWQLWLFVKPALPPHQRRQSLRYVLETPVWFILGVLFGYYVIAPLAINFLGNYSVSSEIKNIIDVGSYMSTVLGVTFAAALAFQLPLLIRLLATLGLITSSTMRQYRKIAVVALLVFAAIITPPDIVSQILIFVPCYALYEYGITIAQRIEVRKAKEEAEYQATLQAQAAEENAAKATAEEKSVTEEAAAEESTAKAAADAGSDEAADSDNAPANEEDDAAAQQNGDRENAGDKQ